MAGQSELFNNKVWGQSTAQSPDYSLWKKLYKIIFFTLGFRIVNSKNGKESVDIIMEGKIHFVFRKAQQVTLSLSQSVSDLVT